MAFSQVDVYDVERMTARSSVLAVGPTQSIAHIRIRFFTKNGAFEDRGTLSVCADESKAEAFEQIARLINALFPEPKAL